MPHIWLQSSIWSNRLRLFYLTLILPLSLFWVIIGYSYLLSPENYLQETWNILMFWWPLLAVWLFIGITLQKQIIFGFTWAKEVSRKTHPEIYNIVENLCIERGLPVPKVGILNDMSMNAFATGWSINKSWIVFSKGLLKKLSKNEIRAVAGHELTHIINGDVKNMVIINVFIWAISSIWYYLFRISLKNNRNKKKTNPLIFLGGALYLLGIILLPLVNLAISRKKEFLADAGSVELTHDSQSMIDALTKISQNAYIEQINDNSSSVASMFIHSPKKQLMWDLFATHPSIEKRIEALKVY